jgi:4-hydroxy-tetrahydrodipicolinate synthase
LCGNRLLQYSGDDATAAAHRAMGGTGCISVTANIVPGLCAKLHRSWDEGDLTEFARLRDELDPLHAALFAESNPIPLKVALSELGLCSDAVRLPLTRAVSATVSRLHTVMSRCDLTTAPGTAVLICADRPNQGCPIWGEESAFTLSRSLDDDEPALPSPRR